MPQIYTLQLSKQGMDLVLAGLNELPHKMSRPVIDEAIRQWTEQERLEQAALAADGEGKHEREGSS